MAGRIGSGEQVAFGDGAVARVGFAVYFAYQRNGFPGFARAYSIKRNAAGEIVRVNVWRNLGAARED